MTRRPRNRMLTRMPYRTRAEAVLAMWREVERWLESLPPGSEDARQLAEESAMLRSEYHRLTRGARKHDSSQPARWPEPVPGDLGPRLEAEHILAEWSEVEEVLNKANALAAWGRCYPGGGETLDVEIDRLLARWAGLRLRYKQLVDGAADRRDPALPDWPASTG